MDESDRGPGRQLAYFPTALRWTERAMLEGRGDLAAQIWTSPDEETRMLVVNLAAMWVKTCFDLADERGVDFSVVWAEARRGPLTDHPAPGA